MTDIQTQGEDPVAMLVERLRERAEDARRVASAPAFKDDPSGPKMLLNLAEFFQEAADAILSLSQERDRLREALEPFANIPSAPLDDDGWAMAKHLWAVIGTTDRSHFTQTDLVRARAALHKEPS